MATSQIETVSTGVDKAKLALSVVLLLAALAGFYFLAKQGAMVQWSVLLGGLVLAVGVFLVSESGKRFIAFCRDSYREVKKVVWPTRKEAVQMTMYVFGFVVVMALFLWLTDKTLEWVFYDLILGWRK
ncbi:preprotein translocase subunit SecE [Simplicispira hankyongi]|uniref:Protein translocase subunit SecE n=1 Tax=Simplicispira hankyongi TaxID=2315688 RepID=A0A398C350_9BURK|nr:preprotein translocase subunit SecE [Simplicispira hankyongi]RID97485.1 preprotein translocase subunit SecE [Simplicispira hankyongi]